jgi:hypothetical protein
VSFDFDIETARLEEHNIIIFFGELRRVKQSRKVILDCFTLSGILFV